MNDYEDELDRMKQQHEWEKHARACERKGVCPFSGERFAWCKATICDCFDYDYEAKIQHWTRLTVWWTLGRTSPAYWPQWFAWWFLGGRRRHRAAEAEPIRAWLNDETDKEPF